MHVFADRIVNATCIEGTVRLQFVVALGDKDSSGNLVKQIVQTVILSDEGFLNSFATLEQTRQQVLARQATPNETKGDTK